MQTKEILAIGFLIIFFVGASYIAREYGDELGELVGGYGIAGMASYVFVATIATVIAPFNALPLIPIAVSLWGSFVTALLSLLGWLLGAVFAFWIARRYGAVVVKKFIDLRRAEEIERMLPDRHILWALIFLRMALPVDILSYALGAFTNVRFRIYFLATIIGMTPFAFIFAYAATIPIEYQILAGIIGFFVVIFGYRKLRKRYKNREFRVE
ncbi:MAG: hypothetical protein COW88_00775 [Candidatus Lloydbacteria bacterium CG22_combo_CG10-13_8_21_14_all_47_15]|uniref:TVP38/TMEM64 family membrane protein n=1 Tax=Candidatus Lloydbacteria bacterium CG22_combo_CG10-13_8_21_14_all_47_15 TaxID=1974635 RepID=A0A2H0CVQ0_9BACT|nr:MAG: hypothetical protein COW88_00775 [Candidatus Lloydbacteria bacterium CG22_combo_CG10-13_8_21_14_all_47_15]